MHVQTLISLAAVFCGMALAAGAPAPAPDGLKVGSMFSDNMVLQRGIPVKVWGMAKPGAEVSVSFGGQVKKTVALPDGAWQATLAPLTADASGRKMTVAAPNGNVVFGNVLVGDVWFCAGQSNMGFSLSAAKDAKQEVAAARHPEIRLYTVGMTPSRIPLKTASGSWAVCAPETARRFSAVAYFFGRELRHELNVPIGLICSSWGATGAESWTALDTLEADPAFLPIVDRYKADCSAEAVAKHKQDYGLWLKSRRELSDPGTRGVERGWAEAGFDDSSWRTVKLPWLWGNVARVNLSTWFRKELELPPSWAGKDVSVAFGNIKDFDLAYFNGVRIGAGGEDSPEGAGKARRYAIPGTLVQPSRNLLAMRVFSRYGLGGFDGQAKDMSISCGDESLEISGKWKYQLETYVEASRAMPRSPLAPDSPNAPGALFNGMVSPVMPYGIKGCVWYQGESNTSDPRRYKKLLPAMIGSWRKGWGQDDFTFLIAQLANFGASPVVPRESSWAELREAQALTAQNVTNCGLAVAVDIGEADDIHPRDKREVGRRLALAAFKTAYGMNNVVCSGPALSSMRLAGAVVRLRFKNLGGGLVAKGGGLKQFALAGEDKVFHWASAQIDGDEVLVSCDAVKQPAYIRYAWADNPEGCNLYNKEGLPAIPFQANIPGAQKLMSCLRPGARPCRSCGPAGRWPRR